VREQRPLLGLFAWVSAAVLAADQASKYAAMRWLDGRPVSLLGRWLRLDLMRNEHSAWGLLPAANLWLIGAAVALCVILLVSTRRLLGRDWCATSALALLVGGAAGNVLDRARLGGVVDFVDLRGWPVFNLADVAVTAGVILLAVHLVRGR
jgi:signal peptidase II